MTFDKEMGESIYRNSLFRKNETKSHVFINTAMKNNMM
jgi:hypothetical protein